MAISLASFLPQPRFSGSSLLSEPKPPSIEDALHSASNALANTSSKVKIPRYGDRKGYIPHTVEDFGDGGAFPEIPVTQYPLNMGKKGQSTAVVPLQMDAQGNVQYDSLVKQGANKDKIVYSQYKDLVEKHFDKEDLARPSAEEEELIAEKTRAALSKIIDGKITAAQPTHVKKQNNEPTFIRYTPSQAQDNAAHNSGSKQRLIRLQEAPLDPLEPPKFKHKKLPVGGGSPPVPVVHSPPRKLTVQDQQNWKIPPCVSNWKNSKGYVIPLDKRLAADGRGLQEVQVNSKFAKLSESLYHAEQNARHEIEARAKLQQDVARRAKQVKEQELRDMAAAARAEAQSAVRTAEEETEDDVNEREKRDEIRRDRKREIRRDLRMEHMGEERKRAARARFDEDRDVSEQIALGAQPKMSGDTMFDQRLFNQDQGLSSGFAGDEDGAVAVYDKPLLRGSNANALYRPKKNTEDEQATDEDVRKLIEKSTSRFKPDRGFQGTEDNDPSKPRDQPVQFQRDESDPFGMNEFLTDAKKANKPNALDAIGKRGHMSASGGSGHGQEYSRKHDSSARGVEFAAAGSGNNKSSRQYDNHNDDDDSSSRDRKRSRR